MSTLSKLRKDSTETQHSLGGSILAWPDVSSTTEQAQFCFLELSRKKPSAHPHCRLYSPVTGGRSLILAEVMQAAGLRAFVGKLSMDISSRPSYKELSAQTSLDAAHSFVEKCRGLTASLPTHERLVEPVLTPRFVPTCSDELLVGLGQMSATENLKIQSHLAEALDQVEYVRKERGVEDIEVFDRVGYAFKPTGVMVEKKFTEWTTDTKNNSSPLHILRRSLVQAR
jgi:cytosine/adenosine deaminase-related metal-dependent hydrolase